MSDIPFRQMFPELNPIQIEVLKRYMKELIPQTHGSDGVQNYSDSTTSVLDELRLKIDNL